MDTRQYLDAAKRKIGAESHADLARALGLSRAALTNYYNGGRTIDDYTAAKVAELLDLDPIAVIAQANAEREKDDGRRAYWQRLAMQAACVLMMSGSLFVTLPTNAVAAESVSEPVQPEYKLSRFYNHVQRAMRVCFEAPTNSFR